MRVAALVLVGATGLLGISGCSTVGHGGGESSAIGPSGGSAAQAALREAVVATTGTSSQRVALTATVEGLAAPLVVTGDGQFDNVAQRGHMTLDVSDLAQIVPHGSSRSGAKAEVEVVADGYSTYVRSDLFDGGGTAPGASWLELWGDDLELSPLLGVAVAVDPGGFLPLLHGARREVVEVGTEELRGATVTHLRAVLDVDDLFAKLDAVEREKVVRQTLGLEAFGSSPPSLPVDVWIDPGGRVRKLSFTFELESRTLSDDPHPLDGGRLTVTLELSDFGKPVDVTVPAADEVRPLDPAVFEAD